MTENLDSRRLALVSAAQQQWIAALTDLGGRNTLWSARSPATTSTPSG